MPTGYTAKLYENKPQSFPEFALSCARAMGALVTMRDSPSDAPIPDKIEPSSYCHDHVLAAEFWMNEVKSWSDDDARRHAETVYQRDLLAWLTAEHDKIALRSRYQTMLVAVRAWRPPTPDHQGLKDFMINQLHDSIDHDCYSSNPPGLSDGPIHKERTLTSARRDLAYYKESADKELADAEGRTAWITALKKSLA